MPLYIPPASGLAVGSAISGGTDKRILFDDGGVVGESAGLSYAKATSILTLGHAVPVANNTYDLGTSSLKFRALYLAGDANIAGDAIVNNCYLGSFAAFIWNGGKARMRSPGDGVIKLLNAAETGWDRLQFGGETSSFPSLKRSTTILQARLADDSAFAPLQGALRTAANAVTGLTGGVLAATTNATIVITDASGQDYRIPCII